MTLITSLQTFGLPSGESIKQALNSQCTNVFLKPQKLIFLEKQPPQLSYHRSKVFKSSDRKPSSKDEKGFASLICEVLHYYRKYVPRLSKGLAPFYKMLKCNEKVLVFKELVQDFEGTNKPLGRCC